MKVNKPIFITGMGRVGSTFFTKVFSFHPNISFLSYLCEKYPTKPDYNRMMMYGMDIPVLQWILRKRITPQECWNFWRHNAIAGVCRDLFKEDVTIKMKSNLQNVMGNMITKKRNRILIHLTGWPRYSFFKEIFSDAKFISIIRDGRAVVNSTINNVTWWEGWRGPHRWGFGEFTSEQKTEWEKYNKSFVALAAIHYKMALKSIEVAKKYISSSDILEIKYEDLCNNPINVFREVFQFCELDWPPKFENIINRYQLKDKNYKWKQDLTDLQRKILIECLDDVLKKIWI